MIDTGGAEPQLCNLFAKRQGLDPIGYAGTLDAFLAFEVPLPWPRGIFESRSKLPPDAFEAIAWFTRELPYRLRPLIIGPDPDYSRPAMRRVMWYSRPAGPMAEYEGAEYLVPEDRLGELVAALVTTRGDAPAFADSLVEGGGRDLLVCTHGTQDAACGRHGVPLYRRLRARAAAGNRVWRVSHFGGHVFAPTALELPSGRFWAYLEDDNGELLLERSGEAAELRDKYRGWAALEGPFLQAFERELLVREGWGWLELPKTSRVVEQDPAVEPRWARVELTAWRGNVPLTHRGLVEISGSVPIRPRSESPERKPYAQYRVTSLEVVDRPAANTVSTS